MKNIIISFSLFTIMVLTMIFSINYLNKSCASLRDTCDKLEDSISNEDWDISYEASLKFLDDIQKNSKLISIFIDHQELDNISNELYKLTQYIKGEIKEESLASLHVIKFYLNHVQELQKINVQNIL
ncbi:DUF4363 family protein [Clostridium amazonitimonense]|uniref:DUF4363 family protein n=1 Tax=Clostridium amazonitimonense TaxID=1499689 RepID=UPI000509BEB3|nr:DUF4363 family protein [Clostridium amazonitimonense]